MDNFMNDKIDIGNSDVNSILEKTSLVNENTIKYKIGRYELTKSETDVPRITIGFDMYCPETELKQYTETFINITDELKDKTDIELCQLAYENHLVTINKVKEKLTKSNLVGWEFIPMEVSSNKSELTGSIISSNITSSMADSPIEIKSVIENITGSFKLSLINE